jgi:hypothetical protein
MTIYRVYLTSYRGNKLPPFYIGSTSQRRLELGYRGSVRSRRYCRLWVEELKNNPHLFKTRWLRAEYKSRSEALAAERRLQLQLNVVRSILYVNQSVAAKNGCFGRDVSKELHPLYGKGHTNEARLKIAANHADVSGSLNGRARWFEFTSPDGEVTRVFGGFKKFCEEHGLPHGSALFLISGRAFTRGPCKGWKCRRL